ncbi:hypothetical protein [Parvularcula maris]|uniref:Uncharacterized protein n=1 Tax=Parvularcula maris TaxID=2965077 RepID=A0A9X2RJK9_9PROT|nr:hypothetical protein [Parvularcula maris]MCQ8184848.1 hypothetical protein [Parvularcula maris]
MTSEVMVFRTSQPEKPREDDTKEVPMSATLSAPTAGRSPALRPRTGRRIMAGFIAYLVFFAVLPQLARVFPFEAMFFGGERPAELQADLTDRYINFAYGLIGAVMTGWITTLVIAMKVEKRAIWNAGLMGLTVWFVLDSGVSAFWGFPLNIATNVLFLVLLGGVLIASRPSA